MVKRKKSLTVQRFGGVDSLGTIAAENTVQPLGDEVKYDVSSLEVKSDSHLEEDVGEGGAAIVRMFEFGMNPQAFAQHRPTKQELFNSHHKGIEIALWKDGMSIITEVNPKIVVDEKAGKYMIFVGAKPMKGHTLHERPSTLKDLIHGRN